MKPRQDSNSDRNQGGAGWSPAPPTVGSDRQNRRRLRALRAGEIGVVAGVEATQVAAKRLADMGFVPGVRVEMVRPGKPCLVRVNGTWMGVGTRYQESILLTLIEAHPAEQPTVEPGADP